MSLLVSGIIYTPIGDKEGFKYPIKYKNLVKKYSYPLPLKNFENDFIGSMISVQKEFYNNVPVFYGLAVVNNKKIINRILRSSLSKNSFEINGSYSEVIHSWCADVNYNEVGKEIKNGLCSCGNPKCKVERELKVKYLELKKISGSSLVDCPCCAYTSIYIPNANGFQNKNIFDLHYERKVDVGDEISRKTFKKIGIDNYKFKSMFGKIVNKISDKNVLNVKSDPEILYNISKKIPYNC